MITCFPKSTLPKSENGGLPQFMLTLPTHTAIANPIAAMLATIFGRLLSPAQKSTGSFRNRHISAVAAAIENSIGEHGAYQGSERTPSSN